MPSYLAEVSQPTHLDEATATAVVFIGVLVALWAIMRLFKEGRILGFIWRIRWGRRARRVAVTVAALVIAATLVKSGTLTMTGITDTTRDLAAVLFG